MEHLLVRRVYRRERSSLQRKKTLTLHRAIRDMSDPFQDPHFRTLYRLTPDVAKCLIAEIRHYYPVTRYKSAIPVEIKFLAALHFYAQGAYQRPDGRDAVVSLSQASVSRSISDTTLALNQPDVLRKWIKFPRTNMEKQEIIDKNFVKFNIPGVIGYLDGTHIIIKKPVVHEELYVNRKGAHSLNVQVVCDCDLLILNILAKYPGSSHDAFIWKASMLRDKMQESSGSWLLGDSGYPLEPWLMTPILNAPDGSQDAKYTRMHILARNSIERCFGVLKNRFRCLHKYRGLEYSPKKAGQIVNACAVLHNVCILGGIGIDAEEAISESQEPSLPHPEIDMNTELYQRALLVRAALINRL